MTTGNTHNCVYMLRGEEERKGEERKEALVLTGVVRGKIREDVAFMWFSCGGSWDAEQRGRE
jgi:hypothetical protein